MKHFQVLLYGVLTLILNCFLHHLQAQDRIAGLWAKKAVFQQEPALNLSSTQPNAQWKKLRITGMILTAAGAAGTAIGIKLARDNSQVAYENKRRHQKYYTGATLAPVCAIICRRHYVMGH
ncbi:hypothetical protein A8C56_19285 [Niabella ginsenosidivorans]|uniref:Uncharacterized protein n=1 Tax=Niabella ginsenosidivorans TaxID=1176587 RepID=A0A1A9I831_9BACT|nr:hypothetical protein [Niabella ginsenosidivorans]ANH82841.1 hypothetical protein A8C56_19285 [Niabella ginsenosidivorans]